MPQQSLSIGHFNHIALQTVNAARCADFYCQVLGFRLVPRPAFSFDGRWLYRSEAGVMLHLIHDDNHLLSEGPTKTHTREGPINTRGPHFAMQSSDITGDLQLLAQHGVETVEHVLPGHGYRQVFFRDPDGNVIEIGEWPAVANMQLE